MMLQHFVTSIIEAMGGIVEPIEYALCEVLIPEQYKEIFQGKTEILLAFDFEVAEENPTSEFITFGSFILDKLIEIINKKTISTIRYVLIDNLKVSNSEEKLKRFLNIDRGSVDIVKQQNVMGAFAVLNFTVGYTSDERVEERDEIWVDLITNKVSEQMLERKNSIFWEENLDYTHPIPELCSTIEAFDIAHNELKRKTERNKLKYKDDIILSNEIKRIEEYYSELQKENEKKKSRKGITEEKIQELKSKAAALLLEKQRQLKEMDEKYSIRTDISLENGILYFVPLIRYTIDVVTGGKKVEKVIYYNAIIREFCCKV